MTTTTDQDEAARDGQYAAVYEQLESLIAHADGEAREEWQALRDILDVEGFGGREYDITETPRSICCERLEWLRLQRDEGTR